LGAPVPEPTPEEKELSAAQEAALGLPLVKVSLRGGGPCPCCGARLEFVENRKCAACGNDFWQEGDAPSVEKPSKKAASTAQLEALAEGGVVLTPGQNEYRVITQADQWFMGKFSPERLTTLLNELSAEGWHVIAVTAADRGTWFGSLGGGARQELVVFLERKVLKDTLVRSRKTTLGDRL
jgi:hypothetical protein